MPYTAFHGGRMHKARIPLVCVGLAAVTLAVYAPVRHYGFVAFDDAQYIVNNPHVVSGLTWRGVGWAFTTGYASNWHPLTWVSHMADAQAFGISGPQHHTINVLLHLLNALLLF